jgi:hypothetical protein
MQLPLLLPCGLLLLALQASPAATFDLGSTGMLSLDVPESWTTTGEPLENHGYDLCFQPPSDEGPQIRFTVIVPPDGKVFDRTQAGATFREVAAEYAKDSVEQEAAIKEKKLSDGFAFYASFTDPDLVGQAVVPGNWRTSTPCVMVLGGKIVVSATIFSDDLAAPDFAESLAVLWSARLQLRE